MKGMKKEMMTSAMKTNLTKEQKYFFTFDDPTMSAKLLASTKSVTVEMVEMKNEMATEMTTGRNSSRWIRMFAKLIKSSLMT